MKFRTKPEVIEAVRFSGSNYADLFNWFLYTVRGAHSHGESVFIPTLEGTMRIDKDDWIIRGVKGEFYPIKDEIFRETYEPVDAPMSVSDGN